MTTRPATIEDLTILLQFEAGIAAAERPFDPTLKEGEIHYYDLAALIRSPEAEVVVAMIGTEIIGSGYALQKEAKPYLKHEKYAHLGFMYVKPAFRGRGVIEAILGTLKAWAKERQIAELRLEVYDGNLPAKRAYTKAGFLPNLLEMRLPLE